MGSSFVRSIVQNGGIAIAASRHSSEEKFKSIVDVSKNELRKIHFSRVNVTSIHSIASLFDSVSKKHGHIDAVVNSSFPRNSMWGAKFEDVAYEDFCENININLGGCFLVCQRAMRFFSNQGYGNIVNISSIYGIIPPKFEIYDKTKMTKEVEYIISKSAIIHFTKYLAKYLKGKNIRVNCLSPGGVFDNQPAEFVRKYNAQCLSKGLLSSDDINGTLLFLLSDHSKYVNGQNIVVDDGFSL